MPTPTLAHLRRLRPLATLVALAACSTETPVRTPVEPTPTPPAPAPPAGPTYNGAQSVANFELLGGYRLDAAYASEGLALVRDADGFAVEIVAGAHAQTNSVHLYDMRAAMGRGTDAATYPLLRPARTWRATELFPRWIDGQNLRDVTVVMTPTGYDLAGIGRVFYNTSPRATTQINIRSISGSGAAATLGATREIAVNLPEQEFSGFIKHLDASRDLGTIGAGAYDSGQGSVGGLSYAVRQSSGTWTRLLSPPGFGDLTSPRLPRDADYSCAEGTSWVCIPPVGTRGVWSTERIGGGGVRYGDHVLFIPTLGYGSRAYARQSYTFGDPALDRAVAYFFRHDASTGAVTFQRYDRWSFAAPGEPVLGVAIGRVRGVTEPVLFVMKANAWSDGGPARVMPALQLFRIKGD
ncbi:MAG: hypothetical protein MUF00_06580 [Gemmatimonadaceae bacterium]|jgi:hypothetical protein|nr:hypothetical protein [Gemmatimonadaceae bacterium]